MTIPTGVGGIFPESERGHTHRIKYVHRMGGRDGHKAVRGQIAGPRSRIPTHTGRSFGHVATRTATSLSAPPRILARVAIVGLSEVGIASKIQIEVARKAKIIFWAGQPQEVFFSTSPVHIMAIGAGQAHLPMTGRRKLLGLHVHGRGRPIRPGDSRGIACLVQTISRKKRPFRTMREWQATLPLPPVGMALPT